MAIHITTKHSGKMKGMVSINSSSLVNPFCMADATEVCQYCYAKRMESYRPRLHECYKANGDFLSEKILAFEYLPYLNANIVRMHAFGELLNQIHYINLANIAIKNYHITFGLWTKRPELIEQNLIPDNLILIHSEPNVNVIDPQIPQGFHKTFAVYTKEFAETNNIMYNCYGKSCMECQLCYSKTSTSLIREQLRGNYHSPQED